MYRRMNNTGLQLQEKSGSLILDGSDILSHLNENEIEYLNSLSHDLALCELLEHYLCNGWQTIDVACFSGTVLESPDGILYADTFHAVKNAVEILLRGDSYTFYQVCDD